MTHNSGDSGLCFEIWFRRRKSQDTYVLQAVSRQVKEAWTKDLERILWEQAARNRGVYKCVLSLSLSQTTAILHHEQSTPPRTECLLCACPVTVVCVISYTSAVEHLQLCSLEHMPNE